MRHALLRIGAVGLASALTAVVLFGIGRLILIGDLGIAMPPQSQASASPSPSISPVVLSDIASPKPSPTATPDSVPHRDGRPH